MGADSEREYKIFTVAKDSGEILSMKIRLACLTGEVMLDAGALINKHQGKGCFLDTNLFVLLLVGSVNTNRIRDFKRTGDFTVEDFRTLSGSA